MSDHSIIIFIKPQSLFSFLNVGPWEWVWKFWQWRSATGSSLAEESFTGNEPLNSAQSFRRAAHGLWEDAHLANQSAESVLMIHEVTNITARLSLDFKQARHRETNCYIVSDVQKSKHCCSEIRMAVTVGRRLNRIEGGWTIRHKPQSDTIPECLCSIVMTIAHNVWTTV